MKLTVNKNLICSVVLAGAMSVAVTNQYSHASTAQDRPVTNHRHVDQNTQLTSLFQFVPEQDLAESKAIAREFVKANNLYKGLSLLLLDSAKTSDIVLKAIKKDGFQNVQMAVVDSIKEVTNTYRFQWDNYLAEIYSHQYTPEILSSVLKWREESPYFKTFISRQAVIQKEGTFFEASIFHQAYADLVHRLQEKFN